MTVHVSRVCINLVSSLSGSLLQPPSLLHPAGHCLHYDSAHLKVSVAFSLVFQHPQVNEPQGGPFLSAPSKLFHTSSIRLPLAISSGLAPSSSSSLSFLCLSVVSRWILAFVARAQLQLFWIPRHKGGEVWSFRTQSDTRPRWFVRRVGFWWAFMWSCRLVICQSEYHIRSDHTTLMPFHYRSQTPTPSLLLLVLFLLVMHYNGRAQNMSLHYLSVTWHHMGRIDGLSDSTRIVSLDSPVSTIYVLLCCCTLLVETQTQLNSRRMARNMRSTVSVCCVNRQMFVTSL